MSDWGGSFDSMNTTSKKDESSNRGTVRICECTGGCGARVHAERPAIALCPSCIGLYEVLDEADVANVAALLRRDTTIRRVLFVIRASKEADRAKLAEDFLHLVAA